MNVLKTGSGLAAAAAMIALAGVASIPSAAVAGAKASTVHCYGVNSCKGTSECKSYGHECKGQNECKGQGFKSLSAKKCAKMGGSLTEK